MLTFAVRGRALAVAAMAVMLVAGSAMPAHASKWVKRQNRLARCTGQQSLSHTDSKTCPANKHRPVLVVRRACCERPNGKVFCHPFPPCPPNSPS